MYASVRYLPDGDVLARCLRVFEIEPVLNRDLPCSYRHDELEHVYYVVSQFFFFFFFFFFFVLSECIGRTHL